MSNMLPIQWRDVATKDDLRVLSAELREDMAGLRTEMADLRTDLTSEIHDAIVGQTRCVTGYVTALSVVMLAVARLLF